MRDLDTIGTPNCGSWPLRDGQSASTAVSRQVDWLMNCSTSA
jgi:hypothetical protein